MGDETKAQLHHGDELGWLVDLASEDRDVRLCKKAAARAKQGLLELRSELATAHRIIGAAIASLGPAWLVGNVSLADGIERKTRALESMPGASAVALIEAVLASHRDDVLPGIRALAERARGEVSAEGAPGEAALGWYWREDDGETQPRGPHATRDAALADVPGYYTVGELPERVLVGRCRATIDEILCHVSAEGVREYAEEGWMGEGYDGRVEIDDEAAADAELAVWARKYLVVDEYAWVTDPCEEWVDLVEPQEGGAA